MELSNELLAQFASITHDAEQKKESNVVYGTVTKQGGSTYVKLDGTDRLTPVSIAMDAEDGDRVMVMIKNHSATITGNITSPASARTASSFMKLTGDGLIVGEMNKNGEITGAYSLISPDAYYIVDRTGKKMASFSANAINLGNGTAIFSTDSINLGHGLAVFSTDAINFRNGAAVFSPDTINIGYGAASFSTNSIKLGNTENAFISLCDGRGSIISDNGTLILNGEGAVGLRSVYSDSDGTYRAETACKADSNSPVAVMQAYQENGSASSIAVRPDGISINTADGAIASLNGSEILSSETLIVAGTVTAKGLIGAGKYQSVEAVVPVPAGYSLTGIRQISTDHKKLCHITQFYTNPSTNTVGATFHNIENLTVSNSSSDDKVTILGPLELTVKIEWFALRSKGATYAGDTVIEWGEE